MLATLAALQLVVLTQVGPPPREVTPDEAATAAQQQEPADPSAPNPPLPRRGEPAPAGEPAAPASPAEATPRAAPPRRQLSLLSAEPLGGASASLAWVGWSSLGIAYAQGITNEDDLGAFVDFDFRKTEFRLGALYRRPLAKAGAFDVAGRLAISWFEGFGSTWTFEDNHSDRGFELAPGLSLSRPAIGGVLSLLGDAPFTITTKYGAGLLFSPRLTVAYEAPLYPDVTVGARVGVGYRAGSGDAPLKEGRADLTFLVLASYQLL